MPMYLRHLSRGITALGLTALGLTACNNDPGSGGLTVTYSFATNSISCDMNQELVEEIRVEIGADGTLGSQSIICDNAGGELVLAGVAAGNHDIIVSGIDADGDAVLDNLGGDPSDERVEVIGGDSKDFPVVLGLAPARLEVALVVNNNGFPAQCSSDEIMIKGIRAQAQDFAAADVLKSHDFDLCEFDGFELVPDDDREINGRRFDSVSLQPLDAAGSPVGTAYELTFAEPVGAGKLAQVAVTCEGDMCTAEVLGGEAGTTTDDPTATGGGTGDDTTGGDDSTGTGGGADGTSTG